nr:hypothetical protein [Nordella sp. HKS 07]
MSPRHREIRLQIMLDGPEAQAVEDWRFRNRMPSRAAAVREIIRRGLVAQGFELANGGLKSAEYGVITSPMGEEITPSTRDGPTNGSTRGRR